MAKRKTIQEIKEFLENNTQIELISNEYINRKIPMRFKCKRCGNEFTTTFGSIISGKARGKVKQYCNDCSIEELSERYSLGQQGFEDKVKNLLGDDYKILGQYKNCKTNIKMKHEKCGYVWDANPTSIQRGSKCPLCSNTFFKTTEIFKEEVKELCGDEFEVIGEYINSHTKIKIKHIECGRIFEITPTNFLNYQSCIICTLEGKSKGEEKIKEVLEKEGIEYKREKRFEDCKSKRTLPFDFYLPKYNMCIEYDGEQHFKPKFNYDEEALKEIQERDKVKTEYCKDKNIKLLRIKYTDFDDIENILKASL